LKNLRSQCAGLFFIACFAAIDSTASFAASTIAFSAHIAMAEKVGPGTSTCFLTGTVHGVGSEATLGPLAVASEDCINPTSATSFLFVSDKVVLSARGGEIWAAYIGSLSATDGSVRGTYFVFGGTGRFKDARGTGTIEGFEIVDFQNGRGTGRIQLTGALTY